MYVTSIASLCSLENLLVRWLADINLFGTTIGFDPGNAILFLMDRQRVGISFLDLPIEIRLMIYRYCLIAPLKTVKPASNMEQYSTGWGTPALDKGDEEIDAMVQRHRAIHQSYVSSCQSYTGVLELEVSLLRLSRTIHGEAASILYGENEFRFVLAITRRHPPIQAPSFWQPSYHDFRDNLTAVSKKYFRLIKKCTVEVRLPTFPWTWAKKVYFTYYGRLAAFAACFGGDDHSLHKVAIFFNRCFRREDYFPLSCLRTSQNVLETLAAIHGVRHSVTVGGVTPTFEAKLSLAMMSEGVAYEPKEEEYGERTVRFRGRNRLQRYKLRRYYESKNVWSQNVLGAYPPRSIEALPAYECCEVCDGELSLTSSHFRRQ